MTSPSGRTAPVQKEFKPLFDWLFVLAVIAVVAIYIRAIYFTPIEAVQREAQKIYYVHVPAAVATYVAVSITGLMSLLYLWLRDERADRLAEASAEVGLVFLTVVLITGPLWGRNQWGAWWVWWDARLTLTLFLWFVVAAYLILRGAVEDPAARARYSAVLAILGALLIPFIHLSVYLFNTMHPKPIAFKPGRPDMSPEMMWTFFPAMGVFTLLCLAFIRARYRYALLREAADALSDVEGR